jgi:hypothetical protein
MTAGLVNPVRRKLQKEKSSNKKTPHEASKKKI